MSQATARAHEFILTLSCRDTTGIVYAVSGLLYQAGCNIIDSQQFGDLETVLASTDQISKPTLSAPCLPHAPHCRNTARVRDSFRCSA